MNYRIILTLVFLSWISTLAFSQKSKDIVIGKSTFIYSKILKQKREILIFLPTTYNDNKYTKYPVLYLLDGKKFFHSFTGAIHQLSNDASPQLPEMIVVGITSQDRVQNSSPTKSMIGYSGNEEKGLEVSGGADDFLLFIEQELFPFINKKYRTNNYKTFVGYSFTGLPILHCLFTKPDMFDSYLSIDFSAWWDDEVTLKHMKAFSQTYKGKSKDIFLTTEERVKNEVYPEKYNATWKFIQEFEQSQPASINFGFKNYEYKAENHHTLPLVSFIDGMKYIFRGHMINTDEMYDTPALIKSRFDTLSQRLGYKISLREDLLEFFGSQFLAAHPDKEKALFYLKYRTECYPESVKAWEALAKSYKHFGEEDAVEAQIQEIVKNFKGKVGVSVININSGQRFGLNQEQHFPMQSVYKFPLALAMFDRIDKGEFHLHQKMQLKKSDLLPQTHSPLRDRYPDGKTDIELKEIIENTVSHSDNNGCDFQFRLLGGASKVDQYIKNVGVKGIQILNTEEEMHTDGKLQYANYSTPRAMSELFAKFYRGDVLSENSKIELWRILKETSTGPNRIKGQLPKGTEVGHKTGWSGQNEKGFTNAINDAGIVLLPNGLAIAISILISDTYETTEACDKVNSSISKLVYEYYSSHKKSTK